MYAEKINSKMIKHSCDVNIPKYDKLDEYVSKNCTDSEDLSDYIGECLFAITRICAEKKISAEESLYNTCKKYTKKFNN